MDVQELGKTSWDKRLGNIDYILHVMQGCLSIPGSPKHILLVAEFISVIPVSPYGYM